LAKEEIVAIGLLTRHDLVGVGAALRNVIPLEDADFSDLLAKIDEADQGSGRGLPPKEIGWEQSPRGEDNRH
jgi:hypothetical protein